MRLLLTFVLALLPFFTSCWNTEADCVGEDYLELEPGQYTFGRPVGQMPGGEAVRMELAIDSERVTVEYDTAGGSTVVETYRIVTSSREYRPLD